MPISLPAGFGHQGRSWQELEYSPPVYMQADHFLVHRNTSFETVGMHLISGHRIKENQSTPPPPRNKNVRETNTPHVCLQDPQSSSAEEEHDPLRKKNPQEKG